jgi:acetyl esterase/lipase
LTQTSPTYESPATNDPLVSRQLNNTLASLYLPHGDARDPDVSAAFADYQGLPPLLIQTSGMEALRGDAEMVRERALAANVEVNFESWAHMIHVWHLFNPILREGRDALQSVANFLVRHLD